MNITFSPKMSNCLRLPERNPSPKPTNKSREPTPQAMPNMVRKGRSLLAQRLRGVCAKMSKRRRLLVNYRGCSGADLRLRTNFRFWDLVRLQPESGYLGTNLGIDLVPGASRL